MHDRSFAGAPILDCPVTFDMLEPALWEFNRQNVTGIDPPPPRPTRRNAAWSLSCHLFFLCFAVPPLFLGEYW
jgi:hypothetical protein